MKRFVLIYLLIINVITFVFYGVDKWKARHSRWRIPEDTLIGLAAAGGSVGALLGMKVWHHKTLHKKFTIGVPVILIIHLIVLGYLIHI